MRREVAIWPLKITELIKENILNLCFSLTLHPKKHRKDEVIRYLSPLNYDVNDVAQPQLATTNNKGRLQTEMISIYEEYGDIPCVFGSSKKARELYFGFTLSL